MRDILDSTDQAAPPPGTPDPAAALWWLAKGGWQTGPEWDRAHEICQRGEGQKAQDWVHALAHWIEGDRANSDYWYRRAGEVRHHEDPAAEARHVLENLAD